MPSLRRSTRARKPVESIYDNAEKRNESTSKRRKSKKEESDDESMVDDDSSLVSQGNEAEQKEDSDKSSAEESEESDDEETEAPNPPPASRNRKASPAAHISKKKIKKKQSRVRKESAPKKQGAPLLKPGSAPNRRQAVTALASLAKKVLTNPEESAENSLAAALLLCVRDDGKSKKQQQQQPRRSIDAATADTESYYTAGIQAVAQRVVAQAKDNARAVEISLLNLIFRCLGETSMLEADTELENMTDEEWALKIEQTVEEMEDTPIDRVLLTCNPSKASVGVLEFRKIFSEFWYQLAAAVLAADGSRFQVEWIRETVARLIELIGVGVPDIRFALSTAIYQMGHAMLDHTVELRSKLATAERQLSVAVRSNSKQKAKALTELIDSWTRIVGDLEEIVKETVMAVFAHRFKDSKSYIRVASLEALTKYCVSRPDIFLTSYYLKYFGWMLSDLASEVRLVAVHALLAPLKTKMDTSGMNSVIAKFRGRLTDCVLDVDLNVQEAAMELLLLLLRKDHFAQEENDRVWMQINNRALAYNTTPAVRRDALYFVMEQLSAFDDGIAQSEREAVAQLAALGQWVAHTLSDSDIPLGCIQYELVDLIVASLRDMREHKHLVCNWAAMLRALQGDEHRGRKSISRGDQRQDTVKQRVLLRMMVTAVTLEVTDAVPDDRTIVDPDLIDARQAGRESLQTTLTHKKKPTRTSLQSSSHEDLTLALLRALPDLLVSFKSETLVLQSLTTLPQYFLASVLNLSSRKKELQALLSNLSTIFQESADIETLNNCCLSIFMLAKGRHSRSDDALIVLKEMVANIRTRLLDLLEKKSNRDMSEADNDDGKETTEVDLESSINLCLRRLLTLSKRCSITDLLIDNDSEDEQLETIGKAVATYVGAELKVRQVIYHRPETQGDKEQVEVPKIWSVADESVHSVVADSVSAGLELILCMTAWRLTQEIERIDDGTADYESEEIGNHVVIRMLDCVRNLIILCFEQFISDASKNFSESHRLFSIAVQEHALRVSGDLRSLFPRQWRNAKSPFLAACSLVDDSVMIAASVRFVRSQEFRIRKSDEGSDEKEQAILSVLLPVARGLCANWESGNRREAGAALAHISGSGKEAHELVQSMARVIKKIAPARFMEAQMACLRQDFEVWAESEPDELSDRPTEAEMQVFETQEKLHRSKFETMQSQATRLSASLGVGKLKGKILPTALLGFVREGVRFAFSTDEAESDDPLPLGCRLSFLHILSKYLGWIRQDNLFKDDLTRLVNEKEVELRNHPEYDEVYDQDKEALAEFRKNGDLGEFVVEDADNYTASHFSTTLGGSTATTLKPRTSMGSSVSSIPSKVSNQASLESIHEEDPSVEEDDAQLSTPKEPKRRRTVLSSAHTDASISTLGQTLDNSDDDETTSM